MANFDRTAGMIQAQTRIVRAVVERHVRTIEPARAEALAALAFIDGAAAALCSHTEVKMAAEKKPRPRASKAGGNPDTI